MIMQWFVGILLGSLLLGQLGGISILPTVVIYTHDVAILLIVCVFAIRALLRRSWIQPTLIIPIVVFWVVGAVSLIYNAAGLGPGELGISALYLLRWVVYSLIYIFLIQERLYTQVYLRWVYVVGTLFSSIGLLQYILYPSLRNLWYLGWDPHYFRLFSTFLDPNFAAIYIILTIFLGIALIQVIPKRWMIAMQIVNGVALFLTYSRSGYLSFAAGLLIWMLLTKQWRILLGFIIFAFVLLLPTPGGDTLRLTRMDSTISRIENWEASIVRIGSSPIIGVGFNTLRYRPIFAQTDPDPTVPSKADAGVDSSILFLAVTTGFAGLTVYIWLVYRMIQMVPRRSPHFLNSNLMYTVWGSLFVHSLFVNSLFYPWILVWLWIVIAAIERSAISGMSRSARS